MYGILLPRCLRDMVCDSGSSSQTTRFFVGKKIVRGLYDYTSAVVVGPGEVSDLNFKKGDIMEILNE